MYLHIPTFYINRTPGPQIPCCHSLSLTWIPNPYSSLHHRLYLLNNARGEPHPKGGGLDGPWLHLLNKECGKRKRILQPNQGGRVRGRERGRERGRGGEEGKGEREILQKSFKLTYQGSHINIGSFLLLLRCCLLRAQPLPTSRCYLETPEIRKVPFIWTERTLAT